ncbi:hypothetical protein Aglo03_10170 [Actinokineospora globicatena]|uniref:Uncharacterized protein n=1 Tax=Actinokineospora globicatena TaxID=103729 RepID=A0A9W6V8Q2_9PSEU|nr:hypothetical protein Aglo03_10170 [Actinokineospora globicatena]
MQACCNRYHARDREPCCWTHSPGSPRESDRCGRLYLTHGHHPDRPDTPSTRSRAETKTVRPGEDSGTSSTPPCAGHIPLTIGMAWHPRHTADGAHDWLRATVRQVLRPDRTTRWCGATSLRGRGGRCGAAGAWLLG